MPLSNALRVAAATVSLTVLLGSVSALADTVNIYTYRQPNLVKPLLDAFTEKTGIKTQVLFAKKGLAQRVASEGANTPADVIMTVDISRLDSAAKMGITQAIELDSVAQNIPAEFRDPKGHWVGLTQRARIIYASKDRVSEQAITYEELAEPKWKGRICTRSGQHVYSIGLVASMIAHLGEEKAQEWLMGLKNNLARKPTGNDRAQVKAIHSGECDIALGNTYYMGKMETNEKDPEQKEWASSVRLMFPNANDRGTHVNLSGVLLTKHAPNKDAALKLIDFLVSPEAQKIYATANFEYPLTPGVAPDERVAGWGDLKPDTLSLSKIADLRKSASEMVDRVGFDDGPAS